jgi:hypothetical protein
MLAGLRLALEKALAPLTEALRDNDDDQLELQLITAKMTERLLERLEARSLLAAPAVAPPARTTQAGGAPGTRSGSGQPDTARPAAGASAREGKAPARSTPRGRDEPLSAERRALADIAERVARRRQRTKE